MRKNPTLTVDAIAIKDGQIVLIKRKNHPDSAISSPGALLPPFLLTDSAT